MEEFKKMIAYFNKRYKSTKHTQGPPSGGHGHPGKGSTGKPRTGGKLNNSGGKLKKPGKISQK